MSSCQKDVKYQKVKTHRLWRRFTKKTNSHNEVHTYWCQFWHQIWRSPKLFKNTFYTHLEGFWSPSYVTSKLTSVCVNLLMWTSFDIFLTTWHLFWHMHNGKCGQMGIMVNTENRDGASWGMGHMSDGAMGHMVNVVMCLIMCNFLNTVWTSIKILPDIDIDVFYLNIQWYSHNGLFKYKNS